MTRALLMATLLLGCAEALPAAATCEAPAEITVHVASGMLLNPDESGVPLPTEIRIHEINDTALFESALFEDAWEPSGPLGESIVSTRTVTLYPGETVDAAWTPSPDARALVGVAIVRRPAGHTWRVIVPVDALPCGSNAAVALRVDEYRIERETEAM